MSLTVIPPELKLEIADLLDPCSAFAFAFTCKTHWQLCDFLIKKHKRLLSEYQILNAGKAGRILWTTLKEILHDPSKGWYVRELTVPYKRQVHWDPQCQEWNRAEGYETCPEEDLALFTAAARALRPLYPLEARMASESARERWCVPDDLEDLISILEKDINQGWDEGIIAVLVHHLPMLRTFRISGDELGEHSLWDLVEQVAIGYNSDRAKDMPFQRLESAAVALAADGGCIPDDWALHFNSFPSLRTFASEALSGNGEDCYYDEERHSSPLYPGDLIPTTSNVKNLYFSSAAIDAPALSQILRRITALERFTYIAGGMMVSESEFEMPKRFFKMLAKYHGHSLEELLWASDENSVCAVRDTAIRMMLLTTLKIPYSGHDAKRVSFRDFQQLKRLSCSWEAFEPNPFSDASCWSSMEEEEEEASEGAVTKEENETFRWKDILPDSLERLHIWDGLPEDNKWRKRILKNIEDVKDSLPNLKEVLLVPWRECGWYNDAASKLLEGIKRGYEPS